ncbi:MAG: hypothetical protein KGH62_05585, partial [Candidatus Micrarchaeota archaeon]|nr:hypothetical protein [Candidatus Micrarchaeota archaeon]
MVVKSRPIRIDDISQLERLPLGVRDAVFGDRLFCRHVNPGGGMGGFVESTARVGGRAIIENGACVLDRSQVYGYSTIHAGEQIS